MVERLSVAGGWYHAVLLAALPWCAALRPEWTPVVAAALVAFVLIAGRPRGEGPMPALLVGLSSLALLVVRGGWVVAGGWLVVASGVALLSWLGWRTRWLDRRVAWFVGLAAWAMAFAIDPELMTLGGWLAPAVLLVASRHAAMSLEARHSADDRLGPPSRDVRGTLSLRSVVASSPDGLPKTVPMDLDLRAGQSLAVLCDSAEDGEALLAMLSGRRRPVAGEVVVDGTPVRPEDRLAAVVAIGEPLVSGDLEMNLSVLSDEFPDRGTVVAVIDVCALEEAADHLGSGLLSVDGAPLTSLERLHVVVGRVIPSSYRLVVVLDPMPWTNAVRGQLWRSAVVRASVGRTAIWITADRDLASRADRVVAFRNGALRDVP